ncbi:response regulator [Anaeromusa acidaminophila]|uniref:response regulator n=1 Tax=Anaeromusa acidaminophila TaxID=81464 RepID=UPI00037A2100|nr:response regulator transcription factor [Anaeromusa acidaminophila]
MTIRVVIADDHALLRQGIRNVLELEPELKVLGEAADGEEAVRLVQEVNPDVLLLDVNMPKGNGLEVTRRLKEAGSPVKIVVLTIHDDQNYVVELVKAGAAGYLLKDVEPSMLIQALKVVAAGETFIYPTLAGKLLGEINRQEERLLETTRIYERRKEERLTYRELDVLELICQGMSNNEVAQKLFLSEKTVKNHLTNIFRKLHVSDRTQAVLYAIKNKMVKI